ncbi:hypothetical protein [Parapedobacter sp. DT-150]|uniref:hypothetical protein n=1 Tax=Parapedobacter sp. DT-150 TaxID=3396162 RepID=UPI003F1E2E47
MHKIILLYSIAMLCCTSVLAQAQLYNEKAKKAGRIVEKRDTSGIDPFTVAARVELVTYSNRMDWWSGDDGRDKPLLKNGMLNMPADSIHSRVQLNSSAVAKWQNALYVTQFCEENIIALCYEPRHLLLFYTANNLIFGYIEICLSCAGGHISVGLREVAFCPERIEYLATLVR